MDSIEAIAPITVPITVPIPEVCSEPAPAEGPNVRVPSKTTRSPRFSEDTTPTLLTRIRSPAPRVAPSSPRGCRKPAREDPEPSATARLQHQPRSVPDDVSAAERSPGPAAR